jgi:hypothetical protein
MKRTSANGKVANNGWGAMTAGQMLLQKPIDMSWANLSRRNATFQEPASEVRHDWAIQANGTPGVTLTAKMAREGLGNYVKLIARVLFTGTGTIRWLLVHSESWKTQVGFQDFATLPPTTLSSKRKLKTEKWNRWWT